MDTSSADWPRCPIHGIPLAAFTLQDASGEGGIDAWICPLLSEHRHEITEEQPPAGGSTEPMMRFLQEHSGLLSRYHREMLRQKELSKTEDTSTEVLPNLPDFTPDQLRRLAADIHDLDDEETHRIPATRRRRRRSFWRWLRRRG